MFDNFKSNMGKKEYVTEKYMNKRKNLTKVKKNLGF